MTKFALTVIALTALASTSAMAGNPKKGQQGGNQTNSTKVIVNSGNSNVNAANAQNFNLGVNTVKNAGNNKKGWSW